LHDASLSLIIDDIAALIREVFGVVSYYAHAIGANLVDRGAK